MPRTRSENRNNELLYEGTISRETLAWLLFGDPQVMYAEAAGYRNEMGVRTRGNPETIQKLIAQYRKQDTHILKMFMDYIIRRDPHLPSELAQDKNGRKDKILSESLSVNPLMFYHDGMTFAIREDGTVAVRGADQPNEIHVAPDTESDQNTDTNTSRAERDLQVVADSILMRTLLNRILDLLRIVRAKFAPSMRTTRITPFGYQGMESVNKDLQQRGQAGDGLYRRYVIDIEADVA